MLSLSFFIVWSVFAVHEIQADLEAIMKINAAGESEQMPHVDVSVKNCCIFFVLLSQEQYKAAL